MAMSTFFNTAPAAAAGVSLARNSELERINFMKERDNYYRAEDQRRLEQELPVGGIAPIDLPDFGELDESLFQQRDALQTYKQSDEAFNSTSEVYNSFMAPIRAKVTNKFGLAAISAYGHHESGFDPANVAGEWSDPSQSGVDGTSGGIMSWRNERLNAMRAFVASKGGDPDNPSPALQGEFLLAEDPALIDKLNAAQSLEEANKIMANAWRFAGYNETDDPNGEYNSRLNTSKSILSQITGITDDGVQIGISSSDTTLSNPTPGLKGVPSAEDIQALQSGLKTQTNTMQQSVWQKEIVDKLNTEVVDVYRNSMAGEVEPTYDRGYQAAQWYKSGKAVQYFNQYPDDIAEARKDPIGFYNRRIGPDAVDIKDRFAGDKTPEATILENEKKLTPGLKEDVPTPPAAPKEYKPKVQKFVADALAKSEGFMNLELQRARQRQAQVNQQLKAKHAQITQDYNRAQQQAEIARRTGSTELRVSAMDRMSALREEALALNEHAAQSMITAEQVTIKLAADMAVRDLERYGNPERMAELWRKIGGTDVQIQPRYDGKFNLVTHGPDGQPVAVAVTKYDLIHRLYADAFSSTRAASAETNMETAKLSRESQFKIIEEQAKQEGLASTEFMKQVMEGKRELADYLKVEQDDGSTVIIRKDRSVAFRVAPAILNDLGFTIDALTPVDVSQVSAGLNVPGAY